MRLFALLFLLLSSVPVFGQILAPTNLTAEAVGASDIKLSWVNVPGGTPPTGHLVERALAPDGAFVQITNVGAIAGTATSYTDTTSEPGIPYKYRVVAHVGTAQPTERSSPSNEVTATAIASPGRPSGLRASDISPTSIRLTWNPVEGAVSYILLREFEDDLEEFPITNGTTYNDTGLTLNTTYTYTVLSVSSTGEESEESLPLSVTTFGDGSGKTAIWGRRFRQIDINADGQLTFGEYMTGHGGVLSWVVIKNRFDSLDTDETPGVNLAEYAKGFGGKKFRAPSKARQFYLADHSSEIPDGELDLAEYTLMRPARTKELKLEKSFGKLDKNDDDSLTPEELKIRNYVDPDLEGQEEEEEEPATP